MENQQDKLISNGHELSAIGILITCVLNQKLPKNQIINFDVIYNYFHYNMDIDHNEDGGNAEYDYKGYTFDFKEIFINPNLFSMVCGDPRYYIWGKLVDLNFEEKLIIIRNFIVKNYKITEDEILKYSFTCGSSSVVIKSRELCLKWTNND